MCTYIHTYIHTYRYIDICRYILVTSNSRHRAPLRPLLVSNMHFFFLSFLLNSVPGMQVSKPKLVVV